MKKLLALAVLSTVSFAAPCFGVDFIRDKIYTSSLYSAGNVSYAIGYHYTDSIKISVEPMLSAEDLIEQKLQGGILVNLHYRYEFTNTDITPYISAGIGSNIGRNASGGLEYGFSYKISSGINLPLSSRTNVFAGYSLLKELREHDHGLEFGISFNL
ncbi:P44/Msp2 family outer membrane protein [Wolbachia endosymbiont of Folsomia candida]|uniref:P44/Msp2 family outer membrane protein n=1 Tax=Wolbachia endosymbiont of Folsomia candida TaxID=169402 RepID=UPI000B6220A6|nr:P44/Msp2 family outer membrane protein [Wolbachia endosymbiont of Folsomia candida]APR98800.1 hypothetical protein ASM33_06250 [Wolbachia endosymbiont of Folsomia candida]